LVHKYIFPARRTFLLLTWNMISHYHRGIEQNQCGWFC